MTVRRGFTLLELIVSIAIAGVIALLVYGSASAGLDTRDALERHRRTAESEMQARVLLADALRHASDEIDPGEVAFQLLDATTVQGLPSDELTFATRGILPPLGASARWTVMLATTPAGLLLRAVPAPDGASTPGPGISTVLTGVRGLDVAVMPVADQSWGSTWTSTRQLPAAVQLTLLDANGAPVGAPVVVRIGLEAVR